MGKLQRKMPALVSHWLGFLDVQSLESHFGPCIAATKGCHLFQRADIALLDFLEGGIRIDDKPWNEVILGDGCIGMPGKSLDEVLELIS